jgi:hypothetical protein
MSELPIQQGGLRVLSGIVPASSASTYGTHYSYLGVGGYVEVPNIDYRDSIPPDSNMNDEGYSTGRRRYGMMVYVIDEDKLYRLFPFSGGSVVSMETFTGTSELNQVTMLSNNNGWIEVPDLSVLITGGTYFSGNSSIVLYDSTGGTVSITGITTTDVVDPGDGRVLVATGDSVNTFVAQSDMVFKNSTLSITGDTFISTTGGTKHPSAILHLDSKTKGLLFPVLTTVEKEAIPNPTSGLTVFDSTLEDLSVYTSSGWTGVIAERDNLQKITERGNTTNRGLIVSGTTYIVGSGSTSGSTAFSVQNSTGGTLLNLFNNGNLNIDNGSLYVDGDNGRVGIGTTSPTSGHLMTVNGNLLISSAVLQINRNLLPQIAMNASGANYGLIQNQSATSWSLAYGSANNTLGTAVLTWFGGTGNVGINTTTDAGYKLDVNGTTRISNTLRVVGSAGYGSNIFEFGVNGGTGQNGYINGFGQWFISNGGTNTTSAFVGGDILRFGQGSTSQAISFSNTNNVIGQWSGIAGTFNNTSTSETIIVVNNQSTANLYGLTIAGDQGAGQTTSKNLLTLSHWGSSGVQTFSNVSSSQSYNLINVNISVSPTQPNKTLRGFYYNPTISGTALSVHRAIEIVTGDVILGSTSGNVGIGTSTLGTSTELTVSGSQTASSAIARGQLLNTTLVASANNDVLVGLDIVPTYTNGAFTGVENYAVRVSNSTVALFDSVLYSQAGTSGSNTTFSIVGTAGSYYTITSSRNFVFNTGQSMYFNTDNDGGGATERAWYFGGARSTTTGGRTYVSITVDSSGFPSLTINNNDNGTRIALNSNSASYFNGGNLLVGTTTDSGYKLDVNGTVKISSTIYLGGNTDMIDPSSNSGFMTIGSNQPIRFTNASSTEFLRIATSGNVLIGRTTDFGYKLDVSGTTRVVSTGSTSGSTTLTLQNSTGRTTTEFRSDGVIGISSASTFTTQVTSVISASTTNSGIAIVPNGTGAFTLNIPDGTATGGNARGQYAIDLQLSRTVSTQVASGDKSIVIGNSNTATNTQSIAIGTSNNSGNVASGFSIAIGNQCSATPQYSITIGNQCSSGDNGGISIGNSNYAAGYSTAIGSNVSAGGYYAVALGKSNSASSDYSTVSGGQSNTTSSGTHATVIGGLSNTASGQYSIVGGQSNTSSTSNSSILGGWLNINSGGSYGSIVGGRSNVLSTSSWYTFIGGGWNNGIINGDYSVVVGGFSNSATTQYAAVIGGNSNISSGLYSLTHGLGNIASSTGSTAIGFYNTASGGYSIAMGSGSTASGLHSTVSGGYNNRATGVGVFIGGGAGNSAGGLDNYQTIVGGNSNTITAAGGSFIGGGQSNTISNGSGSGYCVIVGGSNNLSNGGIYNTIGGGLSNTASASYATVVGGQSNTASGQNSISGGNGNTASGTASVAFGTNSNISSGQASLTVGYGNQASGNWSLALGIYNQATAIGAVALGGSGSGSAGTGGNTASGIGSFAVGQGSSSYLYGQNATAAYKFAANGDAQQSLLTSRAISAVTSGGTVTLSLDGSGTANLIIPNGNNRAWNVVVNTITVCTVVSGGTLTVGDAHSGEYKFLFKRVGGTSTISPITTSSEVADTSMATASYSFSAGTSQQMSIRFNAPNTANNSTFRAVAKVALTEVAW